MYMQKSKLSGKCHWYGQSWHTTELYPSSSSFLKESLKIILRNILEEWWIAKSFNIPGEFQTLWF